MSVRERKSRPNVEAAQEAIKSNFGFEAAVLPLDATTDQVAQLILERFGIRAPDIALAVMAAAVEVQVQVMSREARRVRVV